MFGAAELPRYCNFCAEITRNPWVAAFSKRKQDIFSYNTG
jgi:hypothetical protein